VRPPPRPLLYRPPLPAERDRLRRGRGRAASGGRGARPGLPRHVHVVASVAARRLRRRRVRPPAAPGLSRPRDPARAPGPGGSARGGPARGAGAALRPPAGGPREPGRARARRPRPDAGLRRRAPRGLGREAPRGPLLPPLARAGHRALVQAHGHVRGLARLHPQEGRAADGGADGADPARAAVPARVPVAAPLPLPAGEGQARGPVTASLGVLAAVLALAFTSMAVFALFHQGKDE